MTEEDFRRIAREEVALAMNAVGITVPEDMQAAATARQDRIQKASDRRDRMNAVWGALDGK